MREPRGRWKSCGVVELCRREFAVDLFENPRGYAAIFAILDDNPDISRHAIEAATIYARSHPLIGRPGGRPWVDAA